MCRFSRFCQFGEQVCLANLTFGLAKFILYLLPQDTIVGLGLLTLGIRRLLGGHCIILFLLLARFSHGLRLLGLLLRFNLQILLQRDSVMGKAAVFHLHDALFCRFCEGVIPHFRGCSGQLLRALCHSVAKTCDALLSLDTLLADTKMDV